MSDNNLILGLENFLQTGEKVRDDENPKDPKNPGDQLCYGVITVERR